MMFWPPQAVNTLEDPTLTGRILHNPRLRGRDAYDPRILRITEPVIKAAATVSTARVSSGTAYRELSLGSWGL